MPDAQSIFRGTTPLAVRMRERGITPMMLLEALPGDYDSHWVYAWLCGAVHPDVMEAQRIAAILDCSVAQLWPIELYA